ncbi:conserved Plasmodium protein, unknown function [Plasmodium relictum]|uniref:Uncharacterized protein n=1 Tax=Plasmodium relictum TaxID=85471 RepID=A0A1J1H9I8_PLARL|nr:conserved Plasmodium protein, unknown function [Plasmodium relictum]CRH01175.1 conserved Plasmodium protein, unknown function [Plasmodium relictum]
MENKENEDITEDYFDKITNFFNYFTLGNSQNDEVENASSKIKDNKNKINENKRDSVKQVVYNLKLKRASVLQLPQRFILDTSIFNKKAVNDKIYGNCMTDTSLNSREENNDRNREINSLDISDIEKESKNNFVYSPSFHHNADELFNLNEKRNNEKEKEKKKKKKIKKEKEKRKKEGDKKNSVEINKGEEYVRKREKEYKKKVENKEMEERQEHKEINIKKDKIKKHNKELKEKGIKIIINIEESYTDEKEEKKKKREKNNYTEENEAKDEEEEKEMKKEKEIKKEKNKNKEKKKMEENYENNIENGLIKEKENQETKNQNSSNELLDYKNLNQSSSSYDKKVHFLKNKNFIKNIKNNEELIKNQISMDTLTLKEENISDNNKKYISIRNSKKRSNIIILPKLNLKENCKSFSVEKIKTRNENVVQDNDDKTTVSGQSDEDNVLMNL